jgi:CubicO group peptidase (beta-lactamase class C family)
MHTVSGSARSVAMLCLAWLGILSAPLISQEGPGFADTRTRLVRLHVDRRAADWLDTHAVPGLVVALVKGGKPLIVRGYGLADIDSQTAMDPEHTLVHASCLAMPLTATALLQLVDARLVDLDADVDSYLHHLGIPPTFREAVTARLLLVHTAGFDSRIIARQVHRSEELLPLGDYLEARMPPRIRLPGSVSIESEHGYALAGLLVEEVSGSPFTAYLRSNVFQPLAMSRSSFEWSEELESSLAIGYGLTGTTLAPLSRDLRQTVPASMLASTAADAARWMLALLNEGMLEGHRVLSAESASFMLSRQFSHHPSIAGTSFGLRQGERFESGEFYQLGIASGFSSAVVLLPRRRLGLFVAANRRVPLWDLIDVVLEPYVSRAPGPQVPGPQVPPESISGLSGYYREAGVSQTTIEKLVTLIRQDRVAESAAGELLWRSRRFRPAEQPSLLREVETGEPLALVTDASGRQYLALAGGLMEKVPWFEIRPLQLILWVLFTAVFLAESAWPTSHLPRRLTGLTPNDSFHPRWPLYCVSLAALFHLAFLVTLAATLAWALGEGAQSLAFGVPVSVRVVLSLPLAGAVLSLAATLGVARGWQQGSWTFGLRLRSTLITATLLVFLPFLYDWNLLGFRF